MTTFRDLTKPTFPTFERWRERADAHREPIAALAGTKYAESFVQACTILERFWLDGLMGYMLMVAERPGER